ncbi:MAG: transcription antitermination factor NusB [Ruminococcaceae bacterium]|nr:transcription antitermination factor NusB [Oscillospiraceae bacterium]
MTRGDARELAVHLIYARGFTEEDPQELIRTRMDKAYYAGLSEDNGIYADRPGKGLRTYIDSVVAGVVQETDALNEYIARYSVDWDVSRISRLARAIMQLAIYEVLHMEDVPTGVAISEAVRIAKKYDGDDTGAFVNGILGSFARGLNSEV